MLVSFMTRLDSQTLTTQLVTHSNLGNQSSILYCAMDRDLQNFRVYEEKISLTEELVQNDSHFQAVYDAVLVQGALFVAYTLVHELWITDSPSVGVTQVLGIGSSFFYFLCLESYLSSLAVYPTFLSWVWCHKHGPPQLVGLLYMVICGAKVVVSSVLVFWTSFSAPLTHFTALVAGLEHIRLMMKCWSFIRENAYKVLYPWQSGETKEEGPAVWYGGQMQPEVGSFSAYLYFLFCPVLLYRDRYPRLAGPVNWRNAAGYLIHYLATVWCLVVLLRYFLFPPSFKKIDLVKCYFSALLLGLLLLVLIYMSVLHAFSNLTSELTRFADRQFYNDWWRCSSVSSYYRKWNTIVYDWTYAYLFLDLRALFSSRFLPAIVATLFLSAFMHEYLMALSLGFASPIILIEFAGLGAVFYFVRGFVSHRLANVVMIVFLSVGMAHPVFYYTVELAARTYCPRPLTLREFFVPRMFECYLEHNSS